MPVDDVLFAIEMNVRLEITRGAEYTPAAVWVRMW